MFISLKLIKHALVTGFTRAYLTPNRQLLFAWYFRALKVLWYHCVAATFPHNAACLELSQILEETKVDWGTVTCFEVLLNIRVIFVANLRLRRVSGIFYKLIGKKMSNYSCSIYSLPMSSCWTSLPSKGTSIWGRAPGHPSSICRQH